MKSFGHIDLNQNELQQAVLQVETNFPATPVVGRLVFKGGIVYICLDIEEGTPVWIPLTNEISSYSHVQSTSSDEWVINHNLLSTLPSVQVYDADNRIVFPDDIEIISNSQIKVTFGAAITGRATLLVGSDVGVMHPAVAFEYTQTSLSSTWVVRHYLGYYPATRVFVGNTEIFPDTITHDDLFQTTLTFTSPVMGVARML